MKQLDMGEMVGKGRTGVLRNATVQCRSALSPPGPPFSSVIISPLLFSHTLTHTHVHSSLASLCLISNHQSLLLLLLSIIPLSWMDFSSHLPIYSTSPQLPTCRPRTETLNPPPDPPPQGRVRIRKTRNPNSRPRPTSHIPSPT